MRNTTTIEAHQKDTVATLVRRGKLSEVRIPYSSNGNFLIDHFLGQIPIREFINPLASTIAKYSYTLQNLGARRNVASILGPNPLFWCWPSPTPGTGLKYQLADGDGKWIELSKAVEQYRRNYQNGVGWKM